MISPDELKRWKERATLYADREAPMHPYERQAHERILLLIKDLLLTKED